MHSQGGPSPPSSLSIVSPLFPSSSFSGGVKAICSGPTVDPGHPRIPPFLGPEQSRWRSVYMAEYVLYP